MKKVDKKKNPGLAKLPTKVRNKMGYMKKGGKVVSKMGGGMMKKDPMAMGYKEGGSKKDTPCTSPTPSPIVSPTPSPMTPSPISEQPLPNRTALPHPSHLIPSTANCSLPMRTDRINEVRVSP